MSFFVLQNTLWKTSISHAPIRSVGLQFGPGSNAHFYATEYCPALPTCNVVEVTALFDKGHVLLKYNTEETYARDMHLQSMRAIE